jgi:hypothetical protein
MHAYLRRYALTLLLLFLKILAYAEIYESIGVHITILGAVLKSVS